MLDEGIANQADVGAMFCFGRSEVAATLNGSRVDVDHRGRVPGEADVGDLLVAVASAHGGAGGRPDFFTAGAPVSDRLHVIEFDFAVLEGLDDDVEVSDCERSAGNLKDVRAQVGDLLLHVNVRSLHNRHHGNQRGHAHGESEHGEGGAQLVGAQGAQALGQIVANGEHAGWLIVAAAKARYGGQRE